MNTKKITLNFNLCKQMINENMKLYDNLIYHLYQSDLCKCIQGYDYQQDNIVKLKTLCRLLSFFILKYLLY